MTGKWTRSGEMPEIQRVGFIVSAKDHPELASWLWSLPYRSSSAMVREALLAYLREAVSSAPVESNAEMIASPAAFPPARSEQAAPQPLKVTIPGGVPVGQLGPHYLQTKFGKKDDVTPVVFTHVNTPAHDVFAEPKPSPAPAPMPAYKPAPQEEPARSHGIDDDAINAMRQLGSMG